MFFVSGAYESMQIIFMEDITRLKRLVADLERMQSGSKNAPELMALPVLHDWVPSVRPVISIEGTVEGHPARPDGSRVNTSQTCLLVRDGGETFARTFNRWYRLGSEARR